MNPLHRRCARTTTAALVVLVACVAVSGPVLLAAGTATAEHSDDGEADAYVATQGDDCVELATLGDGTTAVSEFYDYRSGSGTEFASYGTTELQASNVSQVFAYHGPEGESLVFLHDELHGDGTGGGVSMTFAGLPDGTWPVLDDSYESPDDRFQHDGSTARIDWMWAPNRTDGAAFRGLGGLADGDAVTVEPAFGEASYAHAERNWPHVSGDVEWYVRHGDAAGDLTPVAEDEPLDVERGACEETSVAAEATADASTVDVGDAVAVDGSASTADGAELASYEWRFGDGTSATGPTAEHSYDEPGTYAVELTVTAADGTTDATSLSVTVNDPADGGDADDGSDGDDDDADDGSDGGENDGGSDENGDAEGDTDDGEADGADSSDDGTGDADGDGNEADGDGGDASGDADGSTGDADDSDGDAGDSNDGDADGSTGNEADGSDGDEDPNDGDSDGNDADDGGSDDGDSGDSDGSDGGDGSGDDGAGDGSNGAGSNDDESDDGPSGSFGGSTDADGGDDGTDADGTAADDGDSDGGDDDHGTDGRDSGGDADGDADDGDDAGDETDDAGDVRLTDLSVEDGPIAPGGEVTVTATFENGGATAATTAALTVGNETVAEENVTVPAGESETVSFTHEIGAAGTHTVGVGGQRETVTVTDDAGTGGEERAGGATTSSVPGGTTALGLAVVGLVALLGVGRWIVR